MFIDYFNPNTREIYRTLLLKNKRFIKRNADDGKFMDVKSDLAPFKGVRKE